MDISFVSSHSTLLNTLMYTAATRSIVNLHFVSTSQDLEKLLQADFSL